MAPAAVSAGAVGARARLGHAAVQEYIGQHVGLNWFGYKAIHTGGQALLFD
jgi:hypothetical protein